MAMGSTLNMMGDYYPTDYIEDPEVKEYLDKLYYYLSFGNHDPEVKKELADTALLAAKKLVAKESDIKTNKAMVEELLNEIKK